MTDEEIKKITETLADDQEVPDELLDTMSGEDLTALFVEQMILDKGVEATDELRKQLTDEIDQRVSHEVVASMPDYMVAKLEAEMDDKGEVSDETFSKMIEEAGIDMNTLTENVMVAFRNEYLRGDGGKENA